MDAYEKILLNGGNPAQLLGLALAECDAHFTYDEKTGVVSCYEEGAGKLLQKNELENNNRKKLEAWKKKTPENYRDELLEEARIQMKGYKSRLDIRQHVYDSAMQKIDTLESLGSTNQSVQNALNRLQRRLKTIRWESKSNVDYLKKRMEELEEKISALVEWSDETREAVSQELEQRVRDAGTAVDRDKMKIQLNEAAFQRNMETMEAYKEIADLFRTEVEESVEKE